MHRGASILSLVARHLHRRGLPACRCRILGCSMHRGTDGRLYGEGHTGSHHRGRFGTGDLPQQVRDLAFKDSGGLLLNQQNNQRLHP